jgi:hypothetical protein
MVSSKGVKNIRITSLVFHDSHSTTADRRDRRFECHNHGFESGFICKTVNCNTGLCTAKRAGRNENGNIIAFLVTNFSQPSYQYNLYSEQRTNVTCIYLAPEKAQMQVKHSVCFTRLKDVKYK